MRKVWVYDPHSGGIPIPLAVRVRIERRILEHAKKKQAGKFARIEVRFRGALCYIDGYEEPKAAESERTRLSGENPFYLCRIRYFGNEDRWSYAHYNDSDEEYEPSFLLSGEFHGTPEEAVETSTQFY